MWSLISFSVILPSTKKQNKHQIKPDMSVLKWGKTNHNSATEFIFSNSNLVTQVLSHSHDGSCWHLRPDAPSVSPNLWQVKWDTHHVAFWQCQLTYWSLVEIQSCLQQRNFCKKPSRQGKPQFKLPLMALISQCWNTNSLYAYYSDDAKVP